MKLYKFEIPKPSAKRLEANRKFVVQVHGFVDPDEATQGYKIRHDKTHILWEGPDKLKHTDHTCLDADYSYHFYIEFCNNIGNRKEKIVVEPIKAFEEEGDTAEWQLCPSRD